MFCSLALRREKKGRGSDKGGAKVGEHLSEGASCVAVKSGRPTQIFSRTSSHDYDNGA